MSPPSGVHPTNPCKILSTKLNMSWIALAMGSMYMFEVHVVCCWKGPVMEMHISRQDLVAKAKQINH